MLVSGVRLGGNPDPVDVEVAAGRIAAIRPTRLGAGTGSRRVLLPAFVDLHTHLREPGGEASETLLTGAQAGAAGGFAELFAMANTDPPTDTVARLAELRSRAAGLPAGIHPVAAATVGLDGTALVDVEALVAAGVTMFSDDGRCVDDEALVHELLTRLARCGGAFAQHAQSAALVRLGVIDSRVATSGVPGWPTIGEEAVIARDIALAQDTGGHLHICHVSSARSVDLIRSGKDRGVHVTAEVAPHHLELTAADAALRGPELKVNPPLRDRADVAALREALRDGTIDAVATDHAPHPRSAKSLPWATAAFGFTSLETAFPIVADVLTDATTGVVDWDRLTEVLSSAPARIGGIAETAGRPVRVGEPATFVVVEGGTSAVVRSAEHLSLSRNSPFEGRRINHRVVQTVRNGAVTFAAGA